MEMFEVIDLSYTSINYFYLVVGFLDYDIEDLAFNVLYFFIKRRFCQNTDQLAKVME